MPELPTIQEQGVAGYNASTFHGYVAPANTPRAIIDKLSRDFKLGADTHHWAEMINAVNSGEMPPKKDKEKKPSQQEIAAFVTSLDALMKQGRAAHPNCLHVPPCGHASSPPLSVRP